MGGGLRFLPHRQTIPFVLMEAALDHYAKTVIALHPDEAYRHNQLRRIERLREFRRNDYMASTSSFCGPWPDEVTES